MNMNSLPSFQTSAHTTPNKQHHISEEFNHQSILVMRRLTTGIRSEICVVRRVRRCANVIECTYTNLDSKAHYTLRLLLLGYKPVQHVTVLNTVGNCNTVVSILVLYYNLMGPPSYMRSVVGRNVVMRRSTNTKGLTARQLVD